MAAEDPETTSTTHGIFGLKRPGFVLSLLVPAVLFAAILLAAWWTGALGCANFEACPGLAP